MYGWRARVGMVHPSRGDTFTYEFYQVAPGGVVLVNTTLNVSRLVHDHFERALSLEEEAVRVLEGEKVDCILMGGTPVLTLHGMDYFVRFVEDLRKKISLPIVTGVEAVADAVRHVGAKRLLLVSPYSREIEEREIKAVSHFGVEIVDTYSVPFNVNAEITTQPLYATYRYAREAVRRARSSFDAVYITCSRWATLSTLETLEEDLQKPVISASAAYIWKLLSMAGIRSIKPGAFGSLLKSVGETAPAKVGVVAGLASGT